MANITQWCNMTLAEQMGNVGGEIERAIRRKNKHDMLGAQEFCIHAIEMLGYMKQDPKNKRRGSELYYAQQEILDYILGDNLYKHDDESMMKYYNQFLQQLS